MTNLYLSVVIPAFNEADNLKRGTLDLVINYLSNQKYSWEIVLVNDGSTDATSSLLNKFASGKKNISVIDNPHQGKALTVITGALASHGEVILFTDLDQATPITELDKLLVELKAGSDVVIGSRSGRKGAPLFRQILAYGMVFLRAIILRLPFKDTQCGFKVLKASAGQRIFTLMKSLRPSTTIVGPAVDPGFDVELLYLARKMNYKISEVPVAWNYQETRRVRFLPDAVSGLQGLFIVRWRALTNAYHL